MTRRERRIRRFVRYMHRTFKNKLCALALVAVGAVPMIMDRDATAFVFMLIFGGCMFFSNEDWFD